jgi:dipeptidase
MFDVIFMRDNYPYDYVVTAGAVPTLEAARDARSLSGDLVVRAGTREVIADPTWLWDWEKAQPHCYAARKIRDASVAPRRYA